MDVFQNGSDDLFHFSLFAELHESTILPMYRPFPPEQVSSSDLSQYPSTCDSVTTSEKSTQGIDIQSDVSSGNTTVSILRHDLI